MSMLTIPYLFQQNQWVVNPTPLDYKVPAGTIIVVADERCSFFSPGAPLRSDAFMAYRLNIDNPFILERGLLWPENEYPCMTVDYNPFNVAQGADYAEHAVVYEMKNQSIKFEWAQWDNNLRAEGAGSRFATSDYGRLFPPQGEPKYVITVESIPVVGTQDEEPIIISDPPDPIIDWATCPTCGLPRRRP